MTVDLLQKKSGFGALCIPSPDREVNGVYIGDLLSWVMGRAQSGNIWITIMSNINVAAVASLADVSCVILAEGVVPDSEVLGAARAKDINILSSSLPAYDTALLVAEILK